MAEVETFGGNEFEDPETQEKLCLFALQQQELKAKQVFRYPRSSLERVYPESDFEYIYIYAGTHRPPIAPESSPTVPRPPVSTTLNHDLRSQR